MRGLCVTMTRGQSLCNMRVLSTVSTQPMDITRRKESRSGNASNDANHGTHKSTNNPTMNCRCLTAHEQRFKLYTCHLTNHTETSTPSV